MPKIAYKDVNFQKKSLALIEYANDVIAEYDAQGFSLTLRQLYYQLVARDVIKNTPKNYDNLGGLINNGRLAGLIDWYAIEDRTRNLQRLSHWDSPKEILQSAASSFNMDKWVGQYHYLEVWVEKDALKEIVGQAANAYDVPYFSCRGYVSQSEMWNAARRLHGKSAVHEQLTILHLGDHDPSGIDMTRDIRDRLAMFGAEVEVKRIALNMEQVKRYNPPPNPAKTTDSRCKEYIQDYGNNSWELDALEPSVLQKLIKTEIEQYIDFDLYHGVCDKERKDKEQLYAFAGKWD